MAARETWTDERLDDLNKRVDDGFSEMRQEFRAVRGEMSKEFAAVRGEMSREFAAVRGEMRKEFAAVRGEMRDGFNRIDDQMQALQRTMIQVAGAMFATMLVGFLGIFAAILTQM